MTLPDYTSRFRKSRKFLEWRYTPEGNQPPSKSVGKYFSLRELAQAWGVSPETLRYVIADEPGVVKLRSRAQLRLRIPLSVAVQVHSKYAADEYSLGAARNEPRSWTLWAGRVWFLP